MAKKVKIELEKRLDESTQEKNKLETSLQEKLNELESLKTENDKVQAEQISFNQVEYLVLSIFNYYRCRKYHWGNEIFLKIENIFNQKPNFFKTIYIGLKLCLI